MIIGLVPGAMKPYHAGHHFLVQKASNECDSVIIFTTTKDREAIKGSNMKKVWDDIIIPQLPSNVKVEFVVSPVGSVYDTIEWEETKKTGWKYRIYGGTEDISRYNTKAIKQRWPNAGYRFVNVAEEEANRYLRGRGESPNAKGEWVRNSILTQDFKKFEEFLPEILSPYSKEYLNILLS